MAGIPPPLAGPRVLPAGFDEPTFDAALNAIAEIVGKDNVSFYGLEGALECVLGQKHYGDTWPLASDDEHTPSAAIRPQTVSQLQGVLRIANQDKLPLWTVSRGKNLGYGRSGSVVRGTVVVDLHRMNKIIEVNEEHSYAIVEPGVSFFDLYNHIVEKGYNVWTSVPAIGWGSVVGNTTERGFGYTAYGENSQQQCGMEVVLPNGDLLRTGMGALEGSPMFPLFKGGYGPSVDGLFYQSNLGIVTKIGIHLMPAPAHLLDCSASVPNEADLEVLVSIVARLERESIIQSHTAVENLWRQALVHPDLSVQRVAVGPGMEKRQHADDADLAALQKKLGWGFWKGCFAIYAQSEALAQGHWELVQKAFADVPGAVLKCNKISAKDGMKLRMADTPKMEIPHNGVPEMGPVELANARGYGGGHVDFSPLFPSDGKDLSSWYGRARDMLKESNFDFFADFHVYGRYTIAIICIVYAPGEGPTAKKVFEKLLQDAKLHKVSEYRTHIDFMDHVADSFAFGDSALRRFVTGLKSHIDPNGILSQGKSGIWSKGLLKAGSKL